MADKPIQFYHFHTKGLNPKYEQRSFFFVDREVLENAGHEGKTSGLYSIDFNPYKTQVINGLR